MRAASSVPVAGPPVTSRSRGVMSVATVSSGSVRSITSRAVSTPARRPSGWVTIRLVTRSRRMTPWASTSVAPGAMVCGSLITRASARFTRATSATCSSMERKRWMNPIPPARAIAIAMSEPVTVSMFADTTGMASRTLRESRVDTSTSDREAIPLRRGASRTSS